ncbi:MAG: response regulator [Lentisphaerales bacterium]|nr:response regulator [Lentisphaerales bacterium]
MSTKILVVDDDYCSSGIFKAYLDFKEDWEIVTAESPKKALGLLRESKFDVVVSELKIPEMNGMVFLSEVSSKHPEIIRILYSACKLSMEVPSYIHFQYEKGNFSMKELVDRVADKLVE